MRLIDADAIEYTMLYKENWLEGTGYEAQAVWKSEIDKMPTIAESRWIPVTEGLPEEEGEYLCTWGEDFFQEVLYFKRGKWQYYDSECGFVENEEVTAWRPLPEPYEEADE